MQPRADCLAFRNEFVWFNAVRLFWDSQSRVRQMEHPVATGASGWNCSFGSNRKIKIFPRWESNGCTTGIEYVLALYDFVVFGTMFKIKMILKSNVPTELAQHQILTCFY